MDKFLILGSISSLIIFLLAINTLKQKKIENELRDINANLQKSLNFLRVVLDTLPDPIFCKDENGIYSECNSSFEKSLGLRKDEIIGHTVYEMNQGNYGKVYHDADIELMNTRGEQVYESKVKYSDGKLRDILFRKATIVSDKNEVEGLVGIMVDITELKKNEQKLNTTLKINEAMLEINQSIIGMNNIKELFELILEKALTIVEGAEYGSILILKEDNTLEIAASNGYDTVKVKNFKIPLEHSFYWIKTEGKIADTVIINDIYKLKGADIVDVAEEMRNWTIKSCISTPIIINKKLYGMLNIDSNRKDVFNEDDTQVMHYMKNQIQIAIDKHNLYEEIIHLSKYDKLTNLYNKSYFDEVLTKDLKNFSNNNIRFSLVVFDLNKLKYVNDNYGHLAGDEYIKVFAEELRKQTNSSDILARYGGDEFIGVLFNEDELLLTRKFEELNQYLKCTPFNFKGYNITCSFSYGISCYPNDSKSYTELVKIADSRMYAYKKGHL